MSGDPRGERLQIMLTKEELTAVDTWRFGRRMPKSGRCGARITAPWIKRRRLHSLRRQHEIRRLRRNSQ